MLHVRLLGPVEVAFDGTTRSVRGLRRTAVLAALALRPGEAVGADELIDIVWGDTPPPAAPATLQSHISYVRRVLGRRDALLARAPGYVLNLDGQPTDAQAAQRLIRDSAGRADPHERLRLLRQAVALWRGRSLAELSALSWFDAQARRLDGLRRQARHAIVDTRLALGEHAELIPELEHLAQRYPLHEDIHGQLMLALYRTRRQADALAVYRRLRRSLDRELGVEPSQPLRELHVAVLNQDPALDPVPRTAGTASTPARSAPAGIVPTQLPSALAGFTGREDALASLDHLLASAAADGAGPRPATIAVVSGPAGVGKTTLAVYWGQRVAAEFPDGQLYVNLRGFHPSGQALDPAEAVRGFLDAFGVAAQRIPASPEAQVGLYRSLLTGKRVLVVLDNARDAEQVRPLLPTGTGCRAVVTSRNSLAPLVATDAAQPLILGLLSTEQAHDLLTRRLGAARVAEHPDAVAEVIARCARLPLALAIAAARVTTHPEFPLTRLAEQLRDAAGPLDALDAGDASTDVRTVFSWSYRTLSGAAARLFRLLGLHPGPDISRSAATSLAALPPERTRQLLTELTRAHLLTEHAPGRYSLHDLLRAYATHLTDTYDSPDAQSEATHRMLDHYLHSAFAANELLHDAHPLDIAPPQPGVAPEQHSGHRQALDWFAAERPVLLALVARAPDGFDTHTWQLVWTMRAFLCRAGHWHDEVAACRTALAAAVRLSESYAQAWALRALAGAHANLGRLDDADIQLRHALELTTQAGDRFGQAETHRTLGYLRDRQGHLAKALDHNRKALDLYRAVDDRRGEAAALNNIGWNQAVLGNHEQTLVHCRQALALYQELDNQYGQANTWDSLGYAYHHLGDHAQAVACYTYALGQFRDLGGRQEEATALTHLGDAHHAAGDVRAARDAWRQALDILDRFHHSDADDLRARLHG